MIVILGVCGILFASVVASPVSQESPSQMNILSDPTSIANSADNDNFSFATDGLDTLEIADCELTESPPEYFSDIDPTVSIIRRSAAVCHSKDAPNQSSILVPKPKKAPAGTPKTQAPSLSSDIKCTHPMEKLVTCTGPEIDLGVVNAVALVVNCVLGNPDL